MIPISDMAAFCKRKGFIYPNSEIYGGLAGFFDYGPYGVELKDAIKRQWWRFHVTGREDMVGMDGSIIANPKVWEASGHVANFIDYMLTCSKCKAKVRADQYIEEQLNIPADGLKAAELNGLVKKHRLVCPQCKGAFQEIRDFNLMFKTSVGPEENESSTAYLRPETAQLIFTDFKLIMDNARMKLPFGIAQMGRSFRNEISPRNFIFRCREFEQMEIEYFIHPKDTQECPYIGEYMGYRILVCSSGMQEAGKEGQEMSIADALEQKVIRNPWHAYFLARDIDWFSRLGVKKGNLRIRQHLQTEKSHYAEDTWDLEYRFPFGWKELEGFANRTDYDLKAHMEKSRADLSVFDEESKERIVPHVICEPSLGVERAFLVFLYEAYTDDGRGNITLKFHPKLAPVKVGVFPLVNKLNDEARKVFLDLNEDIASVYDKGGSIGRRYARADEIGIPFCVTVDFDTVEKDHKVTIRDRDSTEQKRVPVEGLKQTLRGLLDGSISFQKL